MRLHGSVGSLQGCCIAALGIDVLICATRDVSAVQAEQVVLEGDDRQPAHLERASRYTGWVQDPRGRRWADGCAVVPAAYGVLCQNSVDIRSLDLVHCGVYDALLSIDFSLLMHYCLHADKLLRYSGEDSRTIIDSTRVFD